MTSKGRMFFILHSLGDFTVSVNAAGYKSGQKDVSVATATKYEVEVSLQRDAFSNVTPGPAGIRYSLLRPRKPWTRASRP